VVFVLGAGNIAEAQTPRAARCQGGYFVIEGAPLVPGGTAPDALVVDRGDVSTLSGCPSTRAKVFKRKGRRAGSRASCTRHTTTHPSTTPMS
jgi:hypothetical protein